MNSTTQRLRKEYAGRNVLIVGLGLLGGGAGLVRFFASLGSQVRVTDLKKEEELDDALQALSDISFEKTLGEHKEEDFLRAEVIFKGPSVPWTLPPLQKALTKGTQVEMELSFFASYCPAKIIGVTGTRGKSTTALMLFDILKTSGFDAYVGGNIQNTSTVAMLSRITDRSTVVLELSSWALSGFHRKKISPSIAVFTNLYPDHLNYYGSIENYLNDKKAIYLYQKPEDYLVIHERFLDIPKKDNYKGKLVPFTAGDIQIPLLLKGEHNRENAAAAYAAAQIAGVAKKEADTALRNFKGVPFRLEEVAQKNNVVFINDTTSTSPTATVRAIRALADKPIFLIMGGNSKGLPLDELVGSLSEVKKIYLLPGTLTTEVMTKITDIPNHVCKTLEEAVESAYRDTADKGGGYVLFSPGATSFAQFKNEFDRGEQFNTIVKKLLEK